MKFKGKFVPISTPSTSPVAPRASARDPRLRAVRLPYLELKDVNPGSPLYNQTYSLEEFKGKYVAVLMGAGWCASCLSQAHYLEKIKSDFEAQGRKDIAMVVINAASASSPANQDKMCKCSKSPCPAPGKHLSYTVFQGTGEYDWGTLIDPKTGQNGKKNDCFIYAPDGRFIFKHVGKGTVNLGQFDTEVRDALNTKVEDIP